MDEHCAQVNKVHESDSQIHAHTHMHTHRVCRVCVKNELFHSLSGITASLTIGFHDTAGLGHQRPGGRSGPGSERGSQRNRLRMGMGNKKAGRSLAHSGPRAGANHNIWFGL